MRPLTRDVFHTTESQPCQRDLPLLSGRCNSHFGFSGGRVAPVTERRTPMKIGRWGVTLLAFTFVCAAGVPAAQAGPANARLTHDDGSSGGYVSDYTLA